MAAQVYPPGFEEMQYIFTIPGDLVVGDDLTLWLPVGQEVQAFEALAVIKTVPTGAAVTIEIEKSSNFGGAWTTVVSSADLQIAAAAQSGVKTGLAVKLLKNDVLRINIDQIGSGVAGADLTVGLRVNNG